MRKSGFYPRLAAQNIKKNGKFYLPYLLTCVGCAAMFYTVFFLAENDGINDLRGAQYVQSMLFLGAAVIAIFSAILLLYTNSFLMKRRQKELGLYNILGMEKRHMARFLFWETIYTALIGIVGGLAVGVLLSKLMLLLLCAILRAGVPFGFFVSMQGVLWTAVGFAAIFLISLFANLLRIGRAKPIELLHGGNVGDREPRTRWFLAVVGGLCLAAGYVIALIVKSPITAIGLFFIAVILVIIGTYCLFTAGSIAVLKALRNNKGYYYKTKHFTSVAGMLHRMKRNAAGLASVCILSTMVLVTVSTTVSLYAGASEVIDNMYPTDVIVIMQDSDEESMNNMVGIVKDIAQEEGVEDYTLRYVAYYTEPGVLSENQVAGAMLRQNDTGGIVGTPHEEDQELTVFVGVDFPGGKVPEAFEEFNFWDHVAGMDGDAGHSMDDVTGVTTNQAETDVDLHFSMAYTALRAPNETATYAMYGGFFFIGLYLGFLFLMATALIIYYKQVSEGYEDAEGFKIMQQVGMTEKEVKDSIHSQIMTVFFLPLVTAVIHIGFAFNMMTKMLMAFNLANVGLFALCCLGTALAFAAIYAAVYALTAKAYYGIVKA